MTHADPSSMRQCAEFVLQHLRQESELLESCREALSEVRAGLRHGQGEQLLAAIQRQQDSEVRLAAMSAQCAEVSGRLAALLQRPVGQATIRGLLRQLEPSPLRAALQSARARAQSAARQVGRLCRGNAALIHHRIDLIRRMLCALGAADAGTYEPGGSAAAPPCSTIQRDC